MRLDQYLVEIIGVKSRSKAKDLIKNQGVLVKNHTQKSNKKVFRPSFEISTDDHIEVEFNEKYVAFVNRAALKLKGISEKLGLQFNFKKILDVGVSHGGFSEYVLTQGASEVLGVDVGHDQIDKKVLDHPHFFLIEGLNVKNMKDHFYFKNKKNHYDLILCDVSFLSVTSFLKDMIFFLDKEGELVLLIKPQFELGPQSLNSKGVVKNEAEYKNLKDKFLKLCKNLNLHSVQFLESPLKGKQGNKEFFLYAKK